MKRASKIGVFGGTFDPIHLGHLIAAEEARIAARLDRVLFIPAGYPPHKSKPPRASAQHRTRMVSLAIQGNPDFVLDDREIRAGRTIYTVETLEALRNENGPACALHLIIGGDSLIDLPLWREPQKIFELATVVVIDRPGASIDEAKPAPPGARVVRVAGARVAISASEIRDRLQAGRPIRYFVPEAVRMYIAENKLYSA